MNIPFITTLTILVLSSSLSSCQDNNFTQGERIYNVTCANCHMDDGKGLGTLFPPLSGSDYLVEDFLKIVCVIKKGMKGKIIVNGIEYNEVMPPHKNMTEAEMSNLINYINAQWFNKNKTYGINDIRARLNSCP